MIGELAVAAALAVTGFAILLATHSRPRGSLVWLAIPMGAGAYLVVALMELALAGTLRPMTTLVVTAAIGLAATLVATAQGRWSADAFRWLSITLLVVVVTVILARVLHLTRLTPDSMRYLLFGADMQLPDALNEIHRADLLNRQMGLPSLQALSSLTDRRYLAAIGPLFGVSGFGFFAWVCWRATRDLAKRDRLSLVVSAALFLCSSNRLVYDAFYINTHIEVAVFLLIAIAGSWLAVSTGEWSWMAPAGVALGAMLLLRPESPLIVAIVMVAIGVTRAPWRARVAAGLPSVLIGVVWYGVILWQNAAGGDVISLTAPVFGSLLALFGGTAVLVAGGFPRIQRVVGYADRLLIGALAVALVGLAVANIDVFTRSLGVAFQNVVLSRGAWLLTWTVATPLLLVAFLVQRVPFSRLWTTPIAGFLLTWLLLPMIRGGAWRVGTGDSGNRILGHLLAVVVAFLVLAAVEWWSTFLSDSQDGILAGDSSAGRP